MNYLFLHSAREWSGTARAFLAAAEGLARRGHAVTFAAEPDTTVEHVVSHAAATTTRVLFDVEPFSLEGTWMGAAERLRNLARRRAADVVFVHTDREHLVAASAFRSGSRTAVIRRVPAGRGLLLRRTGRIAASLAPTCYLFASEAELKAAAIPRNATGRLVAPLGVGELAGQTAEELAGVDADIVCIHDASSRSRAAIAIRTVAMLAPRHPDIRLLIIGEGAYDDDLRMQAASLGALQLVHFLGERADQIEVMRTARLGWVVADSDTAAYGVLDFMALGIPVLAGQRSVADGYLLNEISGVLLPPDDAFGAAAIAAELLTDGARRATMGGAGRARAVREFAETDMIDGFEHAAAAATSRRVRK